jgi:hypothetical protein
MVSILRASFVILAISCLSHSARAQNLDSAQIIKVVTPKATKFHGKALFKYPNEHPVSIVTFTQQDLEKSRQDRFLRDLKNATLSRKSAVHTPRLAD